MVWVHVVKTSVRKLYRCQVIIVRHSLDVPLSQTRYWASSDLEADPATLLASTNSPSKLVAEPQFPGK